MTGSPFRSMAKRTFDLVGAFVLLAILSPVLIAAALAIRFRLGSPVLWRQERPGLHGRPFLLLKLRTMTGDRDSAGALLPDRARMTRLGALLRSWSIDELPELVNVLKGEMSLVGPRPLLLQYLERYTPEQARRHEVRPGLTGLAQVSGRNTISWDEKFALDVHYVDHQSLWLDGKILALTVWKVLARHGISEAGQVTAQEFMGSISR